MSMISLNAPLGNGSRDIRYRKYRRDEGHNAIENLPADR